MKKEILLILFTFCFSCFFVSADCGNGQIDINSASLKELDKLGGVGEVKAQAIIDSRPFDSIDDLINVNGIGEVTLNGIIKQGLACVDNEDNEIAKEENEDDKNVVGNNFEYDENVVVKNEETKSIINLNSPVVEEQDYKIIYESKDEKIKKYLIYFFAGFLVLVIFVLLVKR